jgi:hypothetical protein
MWALIFITIALRFSPKRLENFIGFNHKASDLGYYASYDLNYLQKCNFTLKTLFTVQNKEHDAMADHRRSIDSIVWYSKFILLSQARSDLA